MLLGCGGSEQHRAGLPLRHWTCCRDVTPSSTSGDGIIPFNLIFHLHRITSSHSPYHDNLEPYPVIDKSLSTTDMAVEHHFVDPTRR